MTMFCGECGAQNPDTNQFCNNCGKPLKKPGAAAQPPPPPPPVTPGAPQPAASPSYYIPPAGTGTSPLPKAKPERDWPGIGSIVLAILSWLVIPYILGLIAIFFGGISVKNAKKSEQKSPVLGIIGIVIALVSLLVNFFYVFIF